ncbi:MAG: sigma-70 family RNA polymerase sigma factor [Clostridia bacterium]|nr:sigma-70 family RNA polymerase sigma factor [Clostridia bacterium]
MQTSENERLLRLISEGNEEALDELVRSNAGLVRKIALRFCGRGVEYEDLVQIGMIGMINAAKNFDFSYNTVFSTYAVPLIIGEIRRFLRDDGMIKVSRTLKAQAAALMKKKQELEAENGKDVKISELAEACGMSVQEASLALSAACPARSLSEPCDGADEKMTLEHTIADREDGISDLTEKIALRDAISSLSPLHRRIVDLRYYHDLSQQQTGRILGLSQVKVSREEKKLMEILRQAL